MSGASAEQIESAIGMVVAHFILGVHPRREATF